MWFGQHALRATARAPGPDGTEFSKGILFSLSSAFCGHFLDEVGHELQ